MRLPVVPVMEATDDERQEYLLLRSTNGVLKRGDVIQTAAYFRLSRFTVGRIWKQGVSSMGARVAAVVKSRKAPVEGRIWTARSYTSVSRRFLSMTVKTSATYKPRPL